MSRKESEVWQDAMIAFVRDEYKAHEWIEEQLEDVLDFSLMVKRTLKTSNLKFFFIQTTRTSERTKN
jgi:hypothetical protein